MTRKGGRGRRSLHGDRPDIGDLPVDEDVRREIESHIDMRVEELVALGWSPEEARDEALRTFGNRREVERMMRSEARSRDRAVRRTRARDGVVMDLRYAWRSLRGDPGFAILALVTLALGIGANTAIFSVVHGVLLSPLPFPEPEELVNVREWQQQRPTGMSVAWPNYVDWRDRSRSFDGLAAYTAGTSTVLGGERPVRANTSSVSHEFWSVFPVRPVWGRLTSPAEHIPGGDPAVVVSESFWRDELGGVDPASLRLEVFGTSVRVVGVVPDDFSFPEGTEVWGSVEPGAIGSTSRTAHNYSVVGRMAEGVTPALADEDLDRITAAIVEGSDETGEYLAEGALVQPLHASVTGSARTPLLILLAAAAMVLLAACTNLGSTLLARGTARRRELAVRASLGASRSRIVRQLFTESLLLSVLGAAAGTGLAFGLLRLLRAAGEASSLPRLAEIGLDGPVLAFTAAVTILTAFLFGLLPALRLSADGLSHALREGDRGGSGPGGGVWRVLIGVEVALALLLLTGSGLLVRSFQAVLTQERGFEAGDVVEARVTLDRQRYEDAESHARWYGALLEDLAARPGVESAAIASAVPMGGFVPNGRIQLDGDLEKHADAWYVLASGSYFETLDIPLLAGRAFDSRDTPDAPHVAIVNQAFVRTYWPGVDPLGRSVTGGGMDDFWEERTFATVVGVVDDVRYRELTSEARPTVYFPHTQRPFRLVWGGASVMVEARGESTGATGALLREALVRHDDTLPVRVRTMTSVVSDSVAQRRFVLAVMGGFALVALVLAMVGIYGVVSWTVARRTREMGIRLALGAAPGSVRGMVLRQAMLMVAGGLVVGTVAALAAAGVMEALLFQIEARDPVTFLAVVLALVGAAAAASWVPAVRSTRVDPVVTMKVE